MDAVATHGLSKRYGACVALCALDLRVGAGRLFGFLGPNGAGKTTALRILLGLLRATAGRAEVLGREAWRDGPALRTEVGYLPGDVHFYDALTGRATLEFVDAIRGGRCGPEIRRLTECLDLNLDKRVRDYSRGMKQKLGLIVAMMHRPRLLILDEPTTGLDPLIRATLYGELRSIAAEGRTVFFSSHTLAEVEELCDEVAILRDGRLAEQQRMELLKARAQRHVEIHFDVGRRLSTPLPDGLQVLEQSPGALRGTWQGPPDRLLAWLSQCSVQDMTLAPPDLEELFLAYYRCPKGGGKA